MVALDLSAVNVSPRLLAAYLEFVRALALKMKIEDAPGIERGILRPDGGLWIATQCRDRTVIFDCPASEWAPNTEI